MVPLLGAFFILNPALDAGGMNIRRNPVKNERPPKDDADLDSYNEKERRRRWKDVLNELYNHSPHQYGIGKNGI